MSQDCPNHFWVVYLLIKMSPNMKQILLVASVFLIWTHEQDKPQNPLYQWYFKGCTSYQTDSEMCDTLYNSLLNEFKLDFTDMTSSESVWPHLVTKATFLKNLTNFFGNLDSSCYFQRILQLFLPALVRVINVKSITNKQTKLNTCIHLIKCYIHLFFLFLFSTIFNNK